MTYRLYAIIGATILALGMAVAVLSIAPSLAFATNPDPVNRGDDAPGRITSACMKEFYDGNNSVPESCVPEDEHLGGPEPLGLHFDLSGGLAVITHGSPSVVGSSGADTYGLLKEWNTPDRHSVICDHKKDGYNSRQSLYIYDGTLVFNSVDPDGSGGNCGHDVFDKRKRYHMARDLGNNGNKSDHYNF